MKKFLGKGLHPAPLFPLLLIGILTLFLAGQSFYLIKKTGILTDQIESLKTELESNSNTWASQKEINDILLESASDFYQTKEQLTPPPSPLNKISPPPAALSSSIKSVQSPSPTPMPRSIDEIANETTQTCAERGHVNPKTGQWDDNYYQQEGKKKECVVNYPPDVKYLSEADRSEYQKRLELKFKSPLPPLILSSPSYQYTPLPIYQPNQYYSYDNLNYLRLKNDFDAHVRSERFDQLLRGAAGY